MATHDIDVGRLGELPSPELLRQIERTMNAVDEFLVEPLVYALVSVSRATYDGGGTPMPEQRGVEFDDVGRLIHWADTMRMSCGVLLERVGDVVLLAHEDLAEMAAGHMPDGVVTDRDRDARAKLRRFHGLAEVW